MVNAYTVFIIFGERLRVFIIFYKCWIFIQLNKYFYFFPSAKMILNLYVPPVSHLGGKIASIFVTLFIVFPRKDMKVS